MCPIQGSLPNIEVLCLIDKEIIEDVLPMLLSHCINHQVTNAKGVQTYSMNFSIQTGALFPLIIIVLCVADSSTLIST